MRWESRRHWFGQPDDSTEAAVSSSYSSLRISRFAKCQRNEFSPRYFCFIFTDTYLFDSFVTVWYPPDTRWALVTHENAFQPSRSCTYISCQRNRKGSSSLSSPHLPLSHILSLSSERTSPGGPEEDIVNISCLYQSWVSFWENYSTRGWHKWWPLVVWVHFSTESIQIKCYHECWVILSSYVQR
jgi:hypothetical protein